MNNARPIYETASNKAAERFVIGDVCRKFGCTPMKMPDLSPVDYILCKGHYKTFANVVGGANFSSYLYEQMALAEVKCRTTPSDEYPTYMLSAQKFLNGVMLSQASRWPFLLIVCFTDRILYWKQHPDAPLDYAVGGRDDREDKRDMEMVVHIPMTEFSPIVEGQDYSHVFLPPGSWTGHPQ